MRQAKHLPNTKIDLIDEKVKFFCTKDAQQVRDPAAYSSEREQNIPAISSDARIMPPHITSKSCAQPRNTFVRGNA